MKLTTVLFDLDGTLLPMDEDVFIKNYFGKLVAKLAPFGYEPEKLIQAIWTGTKAMIMNDGAATNENVFWNTFTGIYGKESIKDMGIFEDFYRVEFQEVRTICGKIDKVDEIIRQLKEMGLRVVLATNPLFPKIATHSRIRWAGLQPEDFEYITTYENSHYAKPNPKYYEEILNSIGVSLKECIMVGNNTDDDMIAGTLGMKPFLMPECLINKSEKDISCFPQGNLNDLLKYIKSME
ncbi:MAG: HAD family hydrolase [Lachnospiraceae bacterium]|nr:HAD family hydrolase [Lachnospiraceae bacterium]